MQQWCFQMNTSAKCVNIDRCRLLAIEVDTLVYLKNNVKKISKQFWNMYRLRDTLL